MIFCFVDVALGWRIHLVFLLFNSCWLEDEGFSTGRLEVQGWSVGWLGVEGRPTG